MWLDLCCLDRMPTHVVGLSGMKVQPMRVVEDRVFGIPSLTNIQIEDRSNEDVAVDSYHRYKDNVQIMKDMNLDVYKFYMVKNSSEA
ncbi:uncharacterized protein LOC124838040 isoform X3 [Vigna umbellata]|uniref:uncharacterized protein LOC124838040 isoform X3 n=1 Tax=Vigna umbellata TaxID=87088 RepID=UPI001F5EA4FD|nr:uncharacterized protein LOC124838040 isoform X3 [Vigna umbellata]